MDETERNGARMAKYSRQDILDMAEEEDIEFIRLQFTDISGQLKNMATTVNQLEKILDGKCKFDCAAVDGYRGTGYEELFLVPDLDTFVIFPWRPQHGKVARFICDVMKPDGTPFDGDSRYILKRAIAQAREMGYELDVAVKSEFFLFDLDENGEPTNQTSEKGGYFDVGPADGGENTRRDMVLYLADMGIDVETSYHSDEAGQHALDLSYVDALSMADGVMTTRLVARTVARRHGVHATFMPKPKEGVNGSGMHINLSLFDGDGKNVFEDIKDRKGLGLSKTAYAFMAGVLKHVNGMALLTNPLVNSYKRLVPGYDAPIYIGWSPYASRNCLMRIPITRGNGTRVELRSPDSAMNPYLALAVILESGLEGIEKHLELAEPVKKNPFTLTKEERKKTGISQIPNTLGRAIEAFEEDPFMRKVLGEHIYSKYLEAKKEEWREFRAQVTNWEVDQYLFKY